jgi:hypothetical protein
MAALLTGATAFAGFGDIISSFPLPSELLDSQGLTWDGAYLWSCDNAAVFRLTTVGSIVSSFQECPGYSELWGAAYDGSYLWISDQTLFNPCHVTRYTTTGSGVGGFTLYNYGGAGLTWDNGYVWVGEGKYTTSGSLVSSFSTGYGLCDTAFVGHYMWASGPDLTYVYQWTTTGSLVASFPSPDGGQPAGKTFDGQYLWVVSVKASLPYWAYQIDIGVTGADPASLGKIKALYR